MGLFKRKAAPLPETLTHEPKSESPSTDVATAANSSRKQELPKYNHNGHLVTRGIHPDGESGRSGKVSLAPRSNTSSWGLAYTSDYLCWLSCHTPP